jgi:hypothetical protein
MFKISFQAILNLVNTYWFAGERRLEYLQRNPESRGGRRKANLVPGGITGPPCHWGDINTETWSCRLGVGHKADDIAL